MALLLYPSFNDERRDLSAGIIGLVRPFIQIIDLSNDSLTQLLSYGDQDLSNDLNQNILEQFSSAKLFGLIKIEKFSFPIK